MVGGEREKKGGKEKEAGDSDGRVSLSAGIEFGEVGIKLLLLLLPLCATSSPPIYCL
jgi:hypothetical protein